ncbi:MAG: GeoRSP system radical SAM/SPASM protein [Deltaproteobacteria bacterium]|nr:MAG: GeoRSP system radical SAM/SPASM protein [Deltaproteobacteria bacterium]
MAALKYLSSPLIVNWGLTARCNFVCSHCFSRLDTSPELSTAEVLEAAEKMAEAGVMFVNFGTGEPLLRKDLFEVASHCVSLGMKVTMNSNGSLIDEKVVEKIKEAGFHSVGISIDSADPEVHDRFRNHPGSFEKAVRAAKLLREGGVKLTISSVICKINHLDFDRLIDLARSLGASVLDFHNFKCTGMGGLNKEELDLTPSEWRDFYRRALPLKDEVKDLELLFDDPVISLLRDDEGRVVDGSVCGKVSLYVGPDGTITPCGFIPVKVGHILQDDLMDLWENSPVLSMVRNKEASKKCAGCEKFSACLGGCTARAYAVSGNFNEPDPHCWYGEEE